MDDAFGVQKVRSCAQPSLLQWSPVGCSCCACLQNWFTALYKQLNFLAKTGKVPGLKGRQREVFEQVGFCLGGGDLHAGRGWGRGMHMHPAAACTVQVEAEFELLYQRYIVSPGAEPSLQQQGAGAAAAGSPAAPEAAAPAGSSAAELPPSSALAGPGAAAAAPGRVVADADAHRALLMCCLSVATYRVLQAEVEDTRLVRRVTVQP
jgi:hypothetical protein